MTLSRKSSLYSLLFTIFNDAIGWGIVLTIFAPLIFDPHHSILPLDTSDSARNIILGFLIGSYAVTQFISMPLIGALSDHLGRKKVLEWTIFGAMAAFVLSAFAIWFGSLVLLFICRLLAGLFSGNSGDSASFDCRYQHGKSQIEKSISFRHCRGDFLDYRPSSRRFSFHHKMGELVRFCHSLLVFSRFIFHQFIVGAQEF